MATFTVSTNSDEDFNGGTLADELADGNGLSLREAIALANLDPADLDTINFADTVFTGGADSLIRLDGVLGQLTVTGNVTIDGSTATDVIISGDTAGNDFLFADTLLTDAVLNADTADNVRVFNLDDGDDTIDRAVAIQGLTITGGFYTSPTGVGRGGGIYSLEDLTLTDSTVFGNEILGTLGRAQHGGAGVYSYGALSISNSTIARNEAFVVENPSGGGNAPLFGAGLRIGSETTTIENTAITGNVAIGNNTLGGGISGGGDQITITGSTISENSVQSRSSGSGGGAYLGTSGTLSIENSRIENNHVVSDVAVNSGGLRATAQQITVTGSTIAGNNAESRNAYAIGGGAYLDLSGSGIALTIENSSIDGNSATGATSELGVPVFGGGAIIRGTNGTIAISNSTVSNNVATTDAGKAYAGGLSLRINPGLPSEISNSTISNNTADVGGGIEVEFGRVEITNSTITENTARDGNGYGSGILRGQLVGITATSSIIAGNTYSDFDGVVGAGPFSTTSGGNNLIGNGDGAGGAFLNGVNGDIVGTTAAPVDPLLGPLQNNGGSTQTHLPLDGSPALDKGSNPDGLTTDQRGLDRDVDFDGIPPTPDIGSVEVQVGSANFVVTTNDDEAFDGGTLAEELADGDGLSLREAIGLANLAGETADTITFDATEFAGGADSLIRLDAAFGELEITGKVSIDGSTGTDVVVSGDTVGNDALVAGSYVTDVSASNGSLDDNVRVFNISEVDAETSLKDLTVTGGRTTTDSRIYGSTTDGNGGGIRTAATLTITDSTISGNSTTGDDAFGGGIGTAVYGTNGYVDDGNLTITITNSTISGNHTAHGDADGGGIGARASDISVTDSTFSGNRTNDDGGAIGTGGGNVTITNSTLTDNAVYGHDARGGAIRTSGGDVTVVDSTLSDNKSVGIAVSDDSINNAGGAIRTSGGDVTITGSSLIDNAVITDGQTVANYAIDLEGGAIRTSGGNVTVSDSVISGNSVRITDSTTNFGIDAEGGAIRSSGGTLTVTNSSIVNNSVITTGNTTGTNVDLEGGAVRGYGTTTTIVNSTVAGNAVMAAGNTVGRSTYVEGGGLHTSTGDLSFTNVTITGNYSSGDGGAISFGTAYTNGSLTLANSLVIGNGAAGAGNEIALNGAPLTDTAPSIVGTMLYDGIGGTTALPGTVADVAQSIFEDTTSFVDLDGSGTQDAGEPSLGAGIEGGVAKDNGGNNGPTVLLKSSTGNPALDAGLDTAPLNATLDETLLGIDLNGDGDAIDTAVDDVGDFLFDQRGIGFDRLFDQPAAANNGANLIDLGAIEVQEAAAGGPIELALIDTDTDTVLAIIEDGDDIPLALVQGRNVTLSATVPATSPLFGQVEAMFLNFNNGQATRGETVEPYALFGDDTNGDFFDGTMLQLGGQTISLDLFSDDARNNLLETVEFNFNVVDGPNEDPEIVSANANSVNENQTFAIDVQSIDDSDSEGSGLTYEISGGDDAGEFTIDEDTGVLSFINAPDFENPTDTGTDNDYEVEVTVTDSGGLTDSQSITITIDDVDETIQPLVELALVDTDTDQVITTIMDGDAIPLALVQGRNVSLSATVPNTSPLFGQVESMFLDFNNGDVTRGETVEPYALFGDDTAGDFFGGTMLGLGGQTISLDLFSDDARNNLLDTVDFDFTIVDGPNEDPEIVSPNANTVNENQTFAINVQSNDDRDSEGNGLTYSIIGGDDGGLFSIDEDTGVLSFNAAPDFENPTDDNTDNIYNVEVEVEDSGGLTDTQTINITVDDVDETPQAIAEIGIYDTDTNALITLIQDGDVFPVGLFNGNEDDLTIGVVIPNSSPLFGQVQSVFMDLNDGQVTRTENAEIYALSGDFNGDFFDGRDLTGDNTIELDFFSNDDRRGTLLETLEIDFTIDDTIIT